MELLAEQCFGLPMSLVHGRNVTNKTNEHSTSRITLQLRRNNRVSRFAFRHLERPSDRQKITRSWEICIEELLIHNLVKDCNLLRVDEKEIATSLDNWTLFPASSILLDTELSTD
jgi:hypothetical protein